MFLTPGFPKFIWLLFLWFNPTLGMTISQCFLKSLKWKDDYIEHDGISVLRSAMNQYDREMSLFLNLEDGYGEDPPL